MKEEERAKSVLDEDTGHQSLRDYFHILKKTKNDDGSVEIILNKLQLIDPNFTKALNNRVFSMFAEGKEINFVCEDRDLFFTEEEALNLLQNYGQIKDQNGELYFKETLYDAGWHVATNSTKEKVTLLGLGNTQYSLKTANIPFHQVLRVNNKLQEVAKKINEYAESHNLSSYEKYLVCFKYINKIKFADDDEDFVNLRTLVGTIKENKGCCVGKAQSLRALLHLCGINSCCINVNGIAYGLLVVPMLKKYHLNAVVDGMPLDEAKLKFIKDFNKMNKSSKQTENGHQINIVQFEDDKYNMHGIGVADTCNEFCTFCPFEDIDQLRHTFNFTSYAALSHGGGFEDFIREINPSYLPDKKIDRIEREYFTFAIEAIKNQIKYAASFDQIKDDIEASKFNNFLNKIGKCTSLEEIDEVFDNSRENGTEFDEILDKIYYQIAEDKVGILALTAEACENRAALEGCPLAKAISKEKYDKANEIASNAYYNIFKKTPRNDFFALLSSLLNGFGK